MKEGQCGIRKERRIRDGFRVLSRLRAQHFSLSFSFYFLNAYVLMEGYKKKREVITDDPRWIKKKRREKE